MREKAILFSGGLDSWWLKTFHGDDADLVYFDLGTKYSAWELAGLPEGVKVIKVDITAEELGPAAEVFNRNLYFISRLALVYKDIFIGSTADDKKFDNSLDFFAALEKVLHGGRTVHHPLKTLHKQRIYNDLLARLGTEPPYRTCYSPRASQPCGDCPACKLDGSIFRFTLEEFSSDDLPAIERLNVEALEADDIYDPTIEDVFDVHDWWVTMKSLTGEVVGTAGLLNRELIKVRVSPQRRGLGLGRVLFELAHARCAKMWLKTMSPKAISLYQQKGMQIYEQDDRWTYMRYDV